MIPNIWQLLVAELERLAALALEHSSDITRFSPQQREALNTTANALRAAQAPLVEHVEAESFTPPPAEPPYYRTGAPDPDAPAVAGESVEPAP